MIVTEYIQQAKKELDEFEEMWLDKEKTDGWPSDLDEGEWGEQELAARFS